MISRALIPIGFNMCLSLSHTRMPPPPRGRLRDVGNLGSIPDRVIPRTGLIAVLSMAIDTNELGNILACLVSL